MTGGFQLGRTQAMSQWAGPGRSCDTGLGEQGLVGNVQVLPAPVKSVERMREKLIEYATRP
eukprot:1184119-Rhodomonas_salina.1